MRSQPASKDISQNIIQETDARLEEVEYPRFSLPASSLLKKKVKEHIHQLVSESVRVSKRHQADTVSAADVEHANGYLLYSTSRPFFRRIGMLGGILLGVSLTNTGEMIVSGCYSHEGILVWVICGIIGTFLIAKE
ncbi:MAG: hypothetical protein GTN74_08290 [Proteobacteria bacterium]|nr:hypothetical protein [Pseudomonadota bacterium]NIS69825.1 hypothetical protein [Pseudomonadota bacterium]